MDSGSIGVTSSFCNEAGNQCEPSACSVPLFLMRIVTDFVVQNESWPSIFQSVWRWKTTWPYSRRWKYLLHWYPHFLVFEWIWRWQVLQSHIHLPHTKNNILHTWMPQFLYNIAYFDQKEPDKMLQSNSRRKYFKGYLLAERALLTARSVILRISDAQEESIFRKRSEIKLLRTILVGGIES